MLLILLPKSWSLRVFLPLRPLPAGRRLAAARTGVSDCAGLAPNQTQPRSSSRAGLLPPSPLRTVRESFPSHGSSLSNACLTRRGNDTNKEATVEPNTSKESQTIRGRSGRTQRVRVHIDRGGKL